MSDQLSRKSASPLDDLCRAVIEMVAMRADEERLGCDGQNAGHRLGQVDRWYDALEAAITDGLQPAWDRASEVQDAA